MDLKSILEIIGTIVGLLGGGAIVVFALSGWLGKVWADRLMQKKLYDHEKDLTAIKDRYQAELERLRVKLKKSEFLFEREFAAASALVEYHEEIMSLSLHPDMHMDDVYEHIACSLGDVELWIKGYVASMVRFFQKQLVLN